MLSAAAHLASTTALCIAYHGNQEQPVTAASLEEFYNLTPRKLEATVQKLAKYNIIKSMRGVRGGYYVENPEQITLYDVIEPFLNSTKHKQMYQLSYILAPYLEKARLAYLDSLKKDTIAYFIDKAKNENIESLLQKQLNYVI